MFSSVPAEILGLVAGWGFLLIVAAFCFPIRSSYQKPIGKGKIVTAAAVSSIVLVLGIGALSNLFLSWEKAGPSFLLWLTGIAVLEIGLLLAFTYRKTRRWRKQNPLYAVVKMEYRYGLWKERGVMLLSINRVPFNIPMMRLLREGQHISARGNTLWNWRDIQQGMAINGLHFLWRRGGVKRPLH
jgi:hypothetical protein